MAAASFFASLLSCACAAGDAAPGGAAPKAKPGAEAAAQPGAAQANKDAPAAVPEDVERALKAAGWSTITGTWTKKGQTAYEVTDGKLETPKINGAMQVIVYKGDKGGVKVMARNDQKKEKVTYRRTDSSGASQGTFTKDYSTGFGFEVGAAGAKLYTPWSEPNSNPRVFRPALAHDVPAPLPGPRNKFLVSLNAGKLELYLNDIRKHSSNYKLSEEGPFAIEITGTWTIESPQAMGK